MSKLNWPDMKFPPINLWSVWANKTNRVRHGVINVVSKRSSADGEYIGRPSPLGNSFIIDRHGTRDEVIAKYEEWLRKKILAKNKPVCDEMGRLYGIAMTGDLNLVCWCAPLPCHGDVIKRFLEYSIDESCDKA